MRLQSKENDQGQREALHNDERVVHQEDTAVLSGYAPNNRTAKHAKKTQNKTIELKGKIETTVGKDFNPSLFNN